MKIILHTGGAKTIIPIILSQAKCASTSWSDLCKDIVENILTAVDPKLILNILTEVNPEEHFTHYLVRFGGGKALLGHVDWASSADDVIPLLSGYFDLNMILIPRVSGKLRRLAQPHLPVQPAGVPFPATLHVDLCTSAVSSTQPPLPYNQEQMSVLYLTESRRFPGCVDTFEIVAGDGQNNSLPARVTQASSAAARTLINSNETKTAARTKQNAASKGQTAHTKKKANSLKKLDEGMSKSVGGESAKKKPVSKSGKGGATTSAAKKKSPPKESAAAGSKLSLNKSTTVGAAKAKTMNESSSLSKTDSPSIPKVISSKKTTKITPKKGKATTAAAKDDSPKKPSANTNEVRRNRAPSIDKGNEMLRVYEEAKTKENVARKEKTPSKKSKESDDSTKSSLSKKTKELSKNDEARSLEEKSAKKPSAAAAAAAKEDSEEDDKAAPSVDNGKKMLSVWLAAQDKEAASNNTEDSTESSSGKKAKGSSKKKGEMKADKEESSAKKPSASEEDKSAKKKATAAGSEATKASMKKRKASTDDETSDASKSPSKKKAKASKGVEPTAAKEEANANKLEESSYSIVDSVSIPKVISSKKAIRKTPKKYGGNVSADKDSGKNSAAAVKVLGDGRSPAAVVDDQNHLYSDFSAEANGAGEAKTPSKESADSTESSSDKKTNGSSSKKEAAKSNDVKSAKKPLIPEGEVPSKEAGAEERSDRSHAEASKKRTALTKATSTDGLKPLIRKKAKTSKADEVSPSKVTFAADVKKSDGSKKADPGEKKTQKIPVKKSKGNVQKQKLVHCGVCNGCKSVPCRKCSACTATPKRRCKKRPCTNPRFVSMAEYEEMIGLV